MKIRFVFVFYIKNYLIATLIVSWSKLLTVRCPKKTVLICFQFYKKKKEKKIGKTCLKSSLQIEITFLEQDGPLRLLPFINFWYSSSGIFMLCFLNYLRKGRRLSFAAQVLYLIQLYPVAAKKIGCSHWKGHKLLKPLQRNLWPNCYIVILQSKTVNFCMSLSNKGYEWFLLRAPLTGYFFKQDKQNRSFQPFKPHKPARDTNVTGN